MPYKYAKNGTQLMTVASTKTASAKAACTTTEQHPSPLCNILELDDFSLVVNELQRNAGAGYARRRPEQTRIVTGMCQPWGST
jgi:hypothetical protein